MRNKPEILAFVDLETTGLSAGNSRVLEIGIWRTENNVLTDKLITLVDPDSYIDPAVLRLTGINENEVISAPTFRNVAVRVECILEGAVLVAHNAKFDYDFIVAEFKRINQNFECPRLCTAKLLRRIRPDLGRVNLDVLISEYQIKCPNRHRAGDDARVLWDFFSQAQRLHGKEFWKTVEQLII